MHSVIGEREKPFRAFPRFVDRLMGMNFCPGSRTSGNTMVQRRV